MELCNQRQDPIGFFFFFSEGLFSSFLFYFGEDIFQKVNWVASLGQTFFKVVHFLLK